MSELHVNELESSISEIANDPKFPQYVENLNMFADGLFLDGENRPDISILLGRLSFAERQVVALLTFNEQLFTKIVRPDGNILKLWNLNDEFSQEFTNAIMTQYPIAGVSNPHHLNIILKNISKILTGDATRKTFEENIVSILNFANNHRLKIAIKETTINTKEIIRQILESNFIAQINHMDEEVLSKIGINLVSTKRGDRFVISESNCIILENILSEVISNGYNILNNQITLATKISLNNRSFFSNLSQRFNPKSTSEEPKAQKNINDSKRFFAGIVKAYVRYTNLNQREG